MRFDRKTRMVIAGTLAISTFIAAKLIRAAKHDPIAAAMSIELERQGVTKALEVRMHGITDTTEALRIGMELGKKGVARLSTEDLIARSELLLHLDSIAGDTLCAARFMGSFQPTDIRAYFANLDSARLARWAAISATAIKAELEGTNPATRPTQDALVSVVRTIEGNLSEPDRDRYDMVLSAPAAAEIRDQCWAGRTTAATALALPEPRRAEVLRILGSIEAGI